MQGRQVIARAKTPFTQQTRTEPGEGREGIGELSQPEREESTTAVRATKVPPFDGTGLITVGRSGVHRRNGFAPKALA